MRSFRSAPKQFEQVTRDLHERLTGIGAATGYLALILDGSHAVGDTWQTGFSDYDLHAVFSKPPQNLFSLVIDLLPDKTYDVRPWSAVAFGNGHGAKDLSLKLRGKTLYGDPDVLRSKTLPERDILQAFTLGDLRETGTALGNMHERLLAREQPYPVDTMRHLSYPLLKAPFVQIATLDFSLHRPYSRLRQEVIDAHPELPGLATVNEAITHIHNQTLDGLATATLVAQHVTERAARPA